MYTTEIKRKHIVDVGDLDIKVLPKKKRGHPYLLGEQLEIQVRAYLLALMAHGAVVNTAVAIGCAEGIVKCKDSNHSMVMSLTKHWGKHLFTHMDFVKRRASIKAKIRVPNFEEVKAQFLFNIKVLVEMDEIPFDLIINCDQTGIHYVPVGLWTMDKEGSSRVVK